MKKIMILLLIVLMGCTNSTSEPVLVGDNGFICEEVMVAIDEATFDEFTKLSNAGDNIGVLRLKSRDKVFTVQPNTVVIMVKIHTFLNEIKIISGDHAGKNGFIYYDDVKSEC